MSLLFNNPQKIGTVGNRNIIAFGIYNYPESDASTLVISTISKESPDSVWGKAEKITLDSLIKFNPEGIDLDNSLVTKLLTEKSDE